MSKGIELIAAERQRQIEEEGYTPEHDYDQGVIPLIDAGISYALLANAQERFASTSLEEPYTWPAGWEWKPSTDTKRNLVKAGALIAAAIDALEEDE